MLEVKSDPMLKLPFKIRVVTDNIPNKKLNTILTGFLNSQESEGPILVGFKSA